MSVGGKLSTMSFADVVQWARTAHRTGVLKLRDEVQPKPKEVQITFRDGRIVFSATNNRREAFSRYLVFHELCTQEQVEAAIKVQEATGAMFASILVREGTLTQVDAIAVLTEKTTEDLCDVFLWKAGAFEFEPAAAGSRRPSLPLALDPVQIVAEGIRRVDMWARIMAYVHLRAFFEHNEAKLTDGPWEDAPITRIVYAHLDGQHTVDELIQLMPFSRYKIVRAVSELLDSKLIRPSDLTATVDRERRIRSKLEEARNASTALHWTEALEILQGLATAHPGRADIRDEFLRITDGFRSSIYEHNFVQSDVPVVTIGPDALSQVRLEKNDAFILSRIDGRLSVSSILKISPVNEHEGLRAFKRLLNAKVIDFPRR